MANWYDWAGPMYAGMASAEELRDRLLNSQAKRETDQMEALARLFPQPKQKSVDEMLKEMLLQQALQSSGGDTMGTIRSYGQLNQLLNPRQPESVSEQDIAASQAALEGLGVLPQQSWLPWSNDPNIDMQRRQMGEMEARRLKGNRGSVLGLAGLMPRRL